MTYAELWHLACDYFKQLDKSIHHDVNVDVVVVGSYLQQQP